MKNHLTRILLMLLTLLVAACGEITDDTHNAPVIGQVTAEADVYSAVISFHVEGGLSSVSESGVLFGIDKLSEGATGGDAVRVQGSEDPSRHDFIVIELKNLQPSTRYYYRVFIGNGRSKVESEVYTFTTKGSEGQGTGQEAKDWIVIPDNAFREALILRFDRNEDGGIDADEAAIVNEMDISSLGLTDISGIELFPNLRKLTCSDNLISEIDISACPVLNWLDCNPMQDQSHQTVLNTIYIRLDQPIDYLDKPEKTVIRIKY